MKNDLKHQRNKNLIKVNRTNNFSQRTFPNFDSFKFVLKLGFVLQNKTKTNYLIHEMMRQIFA